jgi:hypothetical protein
MIYILITYDLEALKNQWRSPIYSFYKSDVAFQIYNDRPCHFFTCAAPKCKIPAGGVCRFQDSKDKSSTANLKHHAIRCFGEDAVNAAIAGKKPPPLNSSILLFLLAKVNSLSGIHIVCIQPESLVR